MKDFPTRQMARQAKGWWYSKPVLFLLIILIIFLGRATWNVYDKYSLARDNLHRTQAEETLLKNQEATLIDLVEKLKTERGTEEVIRRNLPVVKPGEEMILVVDKEAENDLNLLELEPESANWWEKLLFWD